MKMFGLLATGRYNWCDGRHTIACKFLFTTKEKAEGYIPEFKRKCITPKDSFDMRFLGDNEFLVIQVIEHEVYE